MVPLQGGTLGLGGLRVPGYTSSRGDETFDANWDVISPDFFRTLGVPIIDGRPFEGRDRAGQPYVAIVNETFAARAWPGRAAVGQVLHQATRRDVYDRALTIIGVARDAQYRTVGESPRAFIYVPLAQQPMTEVNIYVRHAPGRAITGEVTQLVAALDPNLPIVASTSFADATSLGLLPQRLAASIAGGVGVVGLLLTALGLYGMMAFHAAQRTREIAVRMALGATRGRVLSWMLWQSGTVAGTGAAVGLLLAAGAAAAMQSLLVGVEPFDAASFLGAGALLGVVLLTASFIPSRRAASADPAVALRAE
jgi:hypothetical protein